VQGVILLVQDLQTQRYSFRSLALCQGDYRNGLIEYKDTTWGTGIHPFADQVFMDIHSYEIKLQPKDYVVKDVVCRESKKHKFVTVIFEVIDKEKKELLTMLRQAFDYQYQGPVRCCLTKFIKGGGNGELCQQTCE
jgi:hypothetical protein